MLVTVMFTPLQTEKMITFLYDEFPNLEFIVYEKNNEYHIYMYDPSVVRESKTT